MLSHSIGREVAESRLISVKPASPSQPTASLPTPFKAQANWITIGV